MSFFTPIFVSNLLSYFAEILCSCAATLPARHNPSRADCDTWNESFWSSSQSTVHFCQHGWSQKQTGWEGKPLRYRTTALTQGETIPGKHTGVCVFLNDSRLIIRANWRNGFPEPTVTHDLTFGAGGGDGNGHSHVMQLLPTKCEQLRAKLLRLLPTSFFFSVQFIEMHQWKVWTMTNAEGLVGSLQRVYVCGK